ncbi:uncharacterized protein MONBRDRAFT_25774 [Monosiga brevicollis MX1]|uniref:Pectin acetylesterase n=1 Tax=Monosiga brevicollis TaxID=81824 RepID=A9V0E1_MONBE|nr:uncharacterized protein MONBRDRAFT_25774 [Monosiga brevicollis MX1]EDQ88996.1 predicted protein [Monosiga brevicollis MX1]|eukprot:XP_001746101.1 hypothetical protein [Monosiga brevicollis MX1]
MLKFLLLVALVAAAANADVPLTLLDKYPNARCMDGTPGGYYFQPSSNASASTKWVISLEGGGECATEDSCKSKLNTSLGSTDHRPKSIGSLGFLGTDDCNENPVMCQWNRVEVVYCSQDLHSGQRAQPSDESWGIIFAGKLIVDAIIEDLEANHGLTEATEIILSGDSAGGLGTWYHLNDLVDRYPQASVYNVPIAGFYFPAYPYTGPNHTQSGLADFRAEAWPGHVTLWQSHMDQDCQRDMPVNDTWKCMLANFSYPYMRAPIFIVEAQTDEVVTTGHDWLPANDIYQPPEQAYLAEWAANMTQGLQRAANSHRDGVFNAACFIHTTFTNSKPRINGLTYHQAMLQWLAGESMVLIDDCGVICNPTCP